MFFACSDHCKRLQDKHFVASGIDQGKRALSVGSRVLTVRTCNL
jgi:hypothetical protein